jgi:hypothetical protein
VVGLGLAGLHSHCVVPSLGLASGPRAPALSLSGCSGIHECRAIARAWAIPGDRAQPSLNWIFLEINPNGQWAWIENETGLPIAAAIADALSGRAR